MNIQEQIKAIDDEIANGAEIEAKLRRYARREDDPVRRKIVEDQLAMFRQRLDRAENERDQLNAYVAEAVIERRVRLIPQPRRIVHFFQIEVTA